MKYIDLHVHTTASDGTLTPRETVLHAVSRNLSAIAITDHDTVCGVAPALLESLSHDIEIIPGIELTADFFGEEIHLLGYRINHLDSNLMQALLPINQEKDERNKKMYANLSQAGIPISTEFMDNLYPGAVITRGHIADFLVSQGYASTKQEAFSRYIGKSCPYYVPRNNVSAEYALQLISTAGGIPVLAHPTLYYNRNTDKLFKMTKTLKSMGLKGIEALYSSFSSRDEADMRRLASHFGLFVTGGSDYHGDIKNEIEMGTGRGNLKISSDILKNLVREG